MTDTRKKIIELISDYMDKHISIGCLIKNKKHGVIETVYVNCTEGSHLGKVGGRGYVLDSTREQYVSSSILDYYNIIGHYDITAVLNYIISSDKLTHISRLIYSKDGNYYEITIGKYKYKILNKPLHLYTEQEEKDLLELLEILKLNK